MKPPYLLNQVKDLNLYSFLENTARTKGDRNALKFVGDDYITYNEFNTKVLKLSFHLQKHGIKPGDKVAIWGENSPNWLISYNAIVSFGGVAVPILPDFSASAVENIIDHSGSKALFISPSLYRKLYTEGTIIGKTVIMLSDFTMHIHKKDEVIKESDFTKFCSQNEEAIKNYKLPKVTYSDLASIIYTSGTTGAPKGVMLTHENLVANSIQAWYKFPTDENDRSLSILPMSHTLEFTLGNIMPVMVGGSIHYLKKPPTASVLLPAMKSVKPTITLTVPLIIEKIYKSKIRPELNKTPLKRMLFKTRFFRKLMHKVAGKQLYNTFGGHLRFFGIGGAKLEESVEQFLLDADFPYAIGYGLTETSPFVGGTIPHGGVLGSCGTSGEGVTYKLIDVDPKTGEGEIVIYGPNIMLGYYRDKELTAQVFTKDGGFRTGDTGILDKKDNLYIIGRIKNMILGPSGENIFPEEIEAAINRSEWVLESLVYELKGKIVARVELNQEEMSKKFQEFKDKAQEMEDEVSKILSGILKNVNIEVSKFSRLSNIFEQKEPFVRTPSKKIKRFLYQDKEANENPKSEEDNTEENNDKQ